MADLITPDFKDWYAKYPKKMARKDAEKAWKRLDDQEKLEAMMDDLDSRYGHIDKQFIPYPATYLRGARWEDELIDNSGGSITIDSTRSRSLYDDLTDTSWANAPEQRAITRD